MTTSMQSPPALLQALMEGSRHRWTYAIFWLLSLDAAPGPALLVWGDGYYKGTEIKNGGKAGSLTDQQHRKRVLRELSVLISDGSGGDDGRGIYDDQDVSDSEWFFLVSLAGSLTTGAGLPGLAMASGLPQWVAGADGLALSTCERARQAKMLGMQTMVCVPVANGVVELGSTELILQTQEGADGEVVSGIRSLFGIPSGAYRIRMQADEDLLALRLGPPAGTA